MTLQQAILKKRQNDLASIEDVDLIKEALALLVKHQEPDDALEYWNSPDELYRKLIILYPNLCVRYRSGIGLTRSLNVFMENLQGRFAIKREQNQKRITFWRITDASQD